MKPDYTWDPSRERPRSRTMREEDNLVLASLILGYGVGGLVVLILGAWGLIPFAPVLLWLFLRLR